MTTSTIPAVSINPSMATPGLAYDLLTWLVTEAKKPNGDPNFVDGTNSDATEAAGAITLFLEFLEDQPNVAGVVKVLDDRDREEQLPIRDARIGLQLRFNNSGTGDTAISGQARAMAAVKALEQIFKNPELKLLTHVYLPSGRRVLKFMDPFNQPLGYDDSQRFQITFEVGMEYIDAITQ